MMMSTGVFTESYFGREVGSDWKQFSGSDGKKQNHKTSQVDLLAWDSPHWRMHPITRLVQGWSLYRGEVATLQTRMPHLWT